MKTILLIAICTVLLLSSETLFAQGKEEFLPVDAVALENKVHVRAGPSLNFEVLGQLNKKHRVVIIGEEYGWCKIKLPKEALCFVHRDYIDQAVVQANRLRARAGAGINFNVLGILKKGQRVKILAEEGEWLRIAPPDNCAGWIKKDYLKLTKKRFPPPVFKPPAPQNQIEVSGIIDDLGKIINRPGAHKLIEGKKILYYLKSENINLNHYTRQGVYIIGEFIDAEDSPYPVINVKQIKVSP